MVFRKASGEKKREMALMSLIIDWQNANTQQLHYTCNPLRCDATKFETEDSVFTSDAEARREKTWSRKSPLNPVK